MMSKVYAELQEWARAGLITDFGPSDLQEDVIAAVLKVVREKIQVKAHDDE